LTEDIKRDGKRVIELNQLLNDVDDQESYEIEQYSDEWPENREHVTNDDLKLYKKTLKERRITQEMAKKSNAYGGGTAVAETTNDSEDEEDGDYDGAVSGVKSEPKVEVKQSENERVHAELLKALPISALEKRRHNMQLRLFRHERDKLRAKIQSTIKVFDDAVDNLRQEKFQLEADLKQTEIKMLILYQELQLLKSFDDREVSCLTRNHCGIFLAFFSPN